MSIGESRSESGDEVGLAQEMTRGPVVENPMGATDDEAFDFLADLVGKGIG